MLGKSKDDNDRVPAPMQQLRRPAAMHSGEQEAIDHTFSICRGMTVVLAKFSARAQYNYSAASKANSRHVPFR